MPARIFIASFICMFLFAACGQEHIPLPKPRLYPKVDYPERNYVQLDTNACSFTFEYPDYMEFTRDINTIKKEDHPCWFNLTFPSLNGDIHFTYTDLSQLDSLDQHLYKIYDDTYQLVYQQDKRASGIEDFIINRPKKNVHGVLFNVEGNAASSFQLMLTDSVNHALRASLYFNNVPDADSMRPVIEFVKFDMMNMINTFEWQSNEK